MDPHTSQLERTDTKPLSDLWLRSGSDYRLAFLTERLSVSRNENGELDLPSRVRLIKCCAPLGVVDHRHAHTNPRLNSEMHFMKTRHAIIIAAMTYVPPLAVHGAVLAGPLTNAANGHIYYLLTTNTWTGAEAEATSLGGHLATINDLSENHWIYTNFTSYAGTPRNLWIGLTDEKIPGAWEWVSGEAASFIYWMAGQPNNNPTYGPQRWAMLSPPSDNVSAQDQEKWNDYWDVPTTIDQFIDRKSVV